MLPTHSAIFVVVALCWCTGCDTIHGVSRGIPLDVLPSPEAVDQAIRATPGVTEVTRVDVPPTTGRSNEGIVHEQGHAQFSCRDAASAFAVVELRETHDTGKHLRVYCIWMNKVPTKDELANVRALVDRLCGSLHQRVPTIPASSPADDHFIGIKGH